MMNGIKSRKFNFRLDADQLKYAALNLAALNRFGSLEQRSFRGTTNMAHVKEWVSILYKLVEFSRQNIHPMSIVNGWRDKGPELLTDIFKDHRESLRHMNEDSLVDKNFWYAAKIASSVDDWGKVDKEVVKKKPRDEELDKLAMAMFKVKFGALKPNQAQMVLNASEDDEVRAAYELENDPPDLEAILAEENRVFQEEQARIARNILQEGEANARIGWRIDNAWVENAFQPPPPRRQRRMDDLE